MTQFVVVEYQTHDGKQARVYCGEIAYFFDAEQYPITARASCGMQTTPDGMRVFKTSKDSSENFLKSIALVLIGKPKTTACATEREMRSILERYRPDAVNWWGTEANEYKPEQVFSKLEMLR